MAHFSLQEYNQATDSKVKAIYDEILTELGFGIVSNLFKSMAINPDVLEANWKKFRATISQGDVPQPLKVIGFGVLAATKPDTLTEVDYQHLQSLGLDQSEIFEIIATANLFTSVNRYTDSIALEIDTLSK
jgi:alkylhydroperoxidase family enzyme